MKLLKKTAALIGISVMVLSFSACTPKVDTTTPEAAMSTAAGKLEGIKSMNSVLTVDVEMESDGQKDTTIGKAEISHIIEPASMKIVNINDTDTADENKVETFAVEENGSITTYMDYAGQWMKQTAPKDEVQNAWRMYDSRANMILLMQTATELKEVSRADKAIVIEGMIPAEKVREVTEKINAFQMIGYAGLPEEYFSGVNNIKVTFNINEATGFPTGYTIEYAPVLQIVMDNVNLFLNQSGSSSLKVNKYLLTVECSDFDKVDKITIPQNVVDTAIDYSSPTSGTETTSPGSETEDTTKNSKDADTAETDTVTENEKPAVTETAE